ncbi:MAG: TonB-dependent receptor [Betaproteobacteria bacterium]
MLSALLLSVLLSGTVHDSTGAVVSGAAVVVRPATGAEQQAVTASDGRFAIEVAPGTVVLIVRAGGFAEQRRELDASAATTVDVVLQPATLLEAVTVTAARSPATDRASATTVLTAEALESTAAPALDDQLKSVPGFSLFRRTSSRVANPTTQGVTMRGLSASGASRTLVLVDGVPLNDAFGGWVHWDQVPQAALDRVEVVRGGASDLYGADAVGGVIQVLTAEPSGPVIKATADVASRSTPRVSMFAGAAGGPWSGFVSGEWQRTDGYVVVAPEERGPVDTPAASAYRTAYGRAGYQRSSWRASASVNLFEEQRRNGTPQQTNDTVSRDFAGELSGTIGSGVWLVRGYGGSQRYNQSFTAVNGSRTAEFLTSLQHVPSTSGGASGQWSQAIGSVSLVAGAETRRVDGTTQSRSFSRGVQTGTSEAGGIQWDTGAFARAEMPATDRLTLVGSLRADRWSSTSQAAGASARTATELSPKAGVTFRGGSGVVWHALVTHAFRAPTLNELFRDFRVGGTVTSANDALQPETLTAVEGGASLSRGPAALRVVAFWNHLTDAITNVTIDSTPQLITRQRRNAGTIRAGGLEVEGEWQATPAVHATLGLQFVDSIFAASQEAGLAGNRVPQVPRVQGAAGVRVNAPAGILATGQFRFTGSQFDDDQNAFRLGPAYVFDLFGSRRLRRGVDVFAAVENLFDDEYDTGRTPTRTIGLPRTIRVGVRAYVR